MTSLRLKTASLIYGALAALAMFIGFVRENLDIYHHPKGFLTQAFSFPIGAVSAGVIGILFGLIVAYATRYTVYRFAWAKTLHQEFRGIFGPISSIDIFGYAAISAVAEELFFRGALQPTIGIVATSTIFGLLHFAPGRKFIPWPIQAIVMGFALGGLFWLTGNLIAPVAAHFTINYQNLHFINRYNPEPELPKSLIRQHHDETW